VPEVEEHEALSSNSSNNKNKKKIINKQISKENIYPSTQ
jgi:hypothetical protein